MSEENFAGPLDRLEQVARDQVDKSLRAEIERIKSDVDYIEVSILKSRWWFPAITLRIRPFWKRT